jgi:hypothetical protein
MRQGVPEVTVLAAVVLAVPIQVMLDEVDKVILLLRAAPAVLVL